MGFSDTVVGLVDRLKPSNKSTSFSGIGSGNQGIVSFEDDVSSLLPTYRQRSRRSAPGPRLTIRSLDDRLQTNDCVPCLSNILQLYCHGMFRERGKFPSQMGRWSMFVVPNFAQNVPPANRMYSWFVRVCHLCIGNQHFPLLVHVARTCGVRKVR